jgi:phosphoribosylamine--glycine ligase
MLKLAVLISNYGTGTNLQAIIDAIQNKKLNAQIVAVISDTNDALGLDRAKKHKIKTVICSKKENLFSILKKHNPDYICLAGWKQIVTDEIIHAYENRIINLHPGLIPDTQKGIVKNPDGTNALWNKGKLASIAVQNFIDQKATYAGSSVHFLTHEFDFGPVLERTFVKIDSNDTVNTLYPRLKKKENEIYVKALQKLIGASVLVIDGGGRGATLVDKYLQSSDVGKVLAVPGNDMMKMSSQKAVVTFPNVKTTDVIEILKIAKDHKVDLVDVAQDDAVAAGVTNALLKAGVKVFGPTKEAGQIEWDKAWARNFMKKYNLPSPSFKICKSEKDGIGFVKSQKDQKWFVKASGLAGGKGAIYAKNNKEAIDAILQMKAFGKSGETFLIEECLVGEEFSSFAIVNSRDFIILGHAQDHKTVFENDKGPNTGGMGCSSPPLVITLKVKKQIKEILSKTVKGFAAEKRHYLGILYLGGMVDKNSKVRIIEFNARWGDPEAEVVLPAIKNDYFELVNMVLDGQIKNINLKKDNLYRVVVAATSKGYPDDYAKVVGKKIIGLDILSKKTDKNYKIFGAGTKTANGNYFAASGRLFYVMGEGRNVHEARKIAYNALSKIQVEGNNLHYRKDIGYKDVNRMK